MAQFSFSRGKLKLKDVDSINVTSKNREGNIYVSLEAKLRNGKTRLIGEMRVTNLEVFNIQTPRFSLKFPSESRWGRYKPNELTLALGIPPISAKWNLKKDQTNDA